MVAIYDYTKQIEDEVDLHAGEEVTIIEQGMNIYLKYSNYNIINFNNINNSYNILLL